MDEAVDSNIFVEWLISLGPGFIIGMAIGYFIKKSFKIFLFFLGAVAVLGLVLNSFEFIELSLDSFQPIAEAGKGGFVWLLGLAEDGIGKMASQGVTGLAGLALGIKIG